MRTLAWLKWTFDMREPRTWYTTYRLVETRNSDCRAQSVLVEPILSVSLVSKQRALAEGTLCQAMVGVLSNNLGRRWPAH
jgi:hypothetical protein